MYVNAEFFAAPFLDRDEFSSWASQNEDAINFSTKLHEALQTSKPICFYDINWLKQYILAIVGASERITGEFKKTRCLLSGHVAHLYKVLKANPNLASTIKSQMSSNFFDNWYNTQPPRINTVRAKHLKRFELLTSKMDHDFELYQEKKLEDIKSILPAGFFLSYDSNGYVTSYYKAGFQRSTEEIIENSGDSDVSELKLLIDKFNHAQSVRQTLRNSEVNALTRLNQFSDKIHDKNFIKNFTADNDSDETRILKTVAYAFTTLVFGLGLYLSYKNKGTCKFWTSGEEELLESTTENLEMQINHMSNPKFWRK
ncbi:hypothetical protein [Legionella qingyii]|uniref:hypothetical protein n=1 Tax=Legionella qingyii TaxID=2184757 RepID=UPI0018F7B442|nr:hypothetical protein [Legionella qingyii]